MRGQGENSSNCHLLSMLAIPLLLQVEAWQKLHINADSHMTTCHG